MTMDSSAPKKASPEQRTEEEVHWRAESRENTPRGFRVWAFLRGKKKKERKKEKRKKKKTPFVSVFLFF